MSARYAKPLGSPGHLTPPGTSRKRCRQQRSTTWPPVKSYPPRDDIPRQRFSARTMRYEPDRGDASQNGLWSYDGYRRAEAWLYDNGSWWFFQTREYAPYLAHPNTTFLRYRRAARQLLVPQPVPLPPLQARAATLASGRLPMRAGAKGPPAWGYENVSEELAERIAQSLGTPLDWQP